MPKQINKRWDEDELQNLLYMYDKGMENKFMARILQRSEASIAGKLYQLRQNGELPAQLPLTEVKAEEKKPEQKEMKQKIVMKKREVYVLVRQAKPSWLERVRCYLNGTKWESVDKVVKQNG